MRVGLGRHVASPSVGVYTQPTGSNGFRKRLRQIPDEGPPIDDGKAASLRDGKTLAGETTKVVAKILFAPTKGAACRRAFLTA